MKLFVGSILISGALALAGCGGSGGGGASGLDERASTSGLQIPIDPPGGTVQVRLVNAFPGFRLGGATYLTHAGNGSNRLFVTTRHGIIWTFPNDAAATQPTVLLDLQSRVDSSTGESGMFAVAFDPQFSSNGYFYVTYVYVPNPASPDANQRTLRLSRFRVNTIGSYTASASSERVILEYPYRNGYHFGGWIGWGPEGNRTLYMSAGDGGNFGSAQDTTSSWGKILRIRINTDGTYSVPGDNPHGTVVWARGFRNPWRCSFDRANGNLWCGDVGENSREEIDLVQRGRNYGWPYFEGSQPLVSGGGAYSNYEPPVYEYSHAVGVAVIGGYVYRGSAVPSLVGRYLYSDAGAPNLWALQTDGSANTLLASGLPDARTFGEDEAGEVYAVINDGTIFRFESAGTSGTGATMPATLSATGLFADTAALTPAPFLIDYSVNAPLWSDGAVKRRWFVLPDGATVGFSASDPWSFPVGTVTVKHFELPLAAGGTTRLETRVMVHRTDGWIGFTYRWRGDQRDADLLTGGASAGYTTIDPASGAPVALTWTFPSQAQCLNCHTQATGRVLGLNTRQLNRSHTYAATGRSANQLRTFDHIGIFGGGVGATGDYPTMPDPHDGTAPLEARAKAYLDANCSMCHRPGGPTPVNMDLRYTTAVADMRLLGVAAERPTVAGALRIAPGSHDQSDLWRRVSSTGSIRMPPLAVSMLDAQAVQLLSAWIDSTR
jgi:uncharacterized repeat protein (TIGR03806 family)